MIRDTRLWVIRRWCIPPDENANFVAAMEDVLTAYARPAPAGPRSSPAGRYRVPATGRRQSLPGGRPQLGWRSVQVADQRRRPDFAHALRDLADVAFPEAGRIVLVLDNVNTHCAGALCVTVRGRGPPDLAALRGAFHTEAWELAQHGRNRVGRAASAVSGPPPGPPWTRNWKPGSRTAMARRCVTTVAAD